MYGTLSPRKQSTRYIADDRGYLLSSSGKLSNSFNHPKKLYETSAARWPKVHNKSTLILHDVLHLDKLNWYILEHVSAKLSSHLIPALPEKTRSHAQCSACTLHNICSDHVFLLAVQPLDQHWSSCHNGIQRHCDRLLECINCVHSQR